MKSNKKNYRQIAKYLWGKEINSFGKNIFKK